MNHTQFGVKHIRTNAYNGNEEEVPEGTAFGFWRVIEYTGAGWFPLPGLHTNRVDAVQSRLSLMDRA